MAASIMYVALQRVVTRNHIADHAQISKHTLNRPVEYIVQGMYIVMSGSTELTLLTEHPTIRSISFHPGSVKTELFRASKLEELGAPADDPPELPAAVLLYLTSGKVDWLNGR